MGENSPGAAAGRGPRVRAGPGPAERGCAAVRARGIKRGACAVNDGRTSRDRGLPTGKSREKSSDADRWFDLELNRIYSDVIKEPLPREFLELVAKLGQRKPRSK